jgi:hypothetical protein
MEQHFKIEIISLFERETNLYTGVIRFLEGDDEAEGGDYINYGGTYIDMTTQVEWDVSPFRAFLGAKAHAEKLRMIGLSSKEDGIVPYKGMILEQIKEG